MLDNIPEPTCLNNREDLKNEKIFENFNIYTIMKTSNPVITQHLIEIIQHVSH